MLTTTLSQQHSFMFIDASAYYQSNLRRFVKCAHNSLCGYRISILRSMPAFDHRTPHVVPSCMFLLVFDSLEPSSALGVRSLSSENRDTVVVRVRQLTFYPYLRGQVLTSHFGCAALMLLIWASLPFFLSSVVDLCCILQSVLFLHYGLSSHEETSHNWLQSAMQHLTHQRADPLSKQYGI